MSSLCNSFVVHTNHIRRVLQVSRKEKVKQRPQGLNTVEMLRVASAALGLSPHTAMTVAERLYTSGYINYPRTESTAYPPTFDLRALVQHQVRCLIALGLCLVISLFVLRS